MVDYLVSNTSQAKAPKENFLLLFIWLQMGSLFLWSHLQVLLIPHLNPQPVEKRELSGEFIHIQSIYFCLKLDILTSEPSVL